MTAGSGGPPVQRLTAALLLQGPVLAEVRWVLQVGAREIWRRDSIPPSATITSLLRDLQELAAARSGNAEVPSPAEREALMTETRISTAEAAGLLGMGSRQVRNIQDRLGGRKLGGVLTLELAAVQAEAARRRESA